MSLAEDTNIEHLPARRDRSPVTAGQSIRAIVPRDLNEAFRVGEAIFQSGLAPYGLDSAQKVCVAVMYGLEIGLPPMQAVQSIGIINGRPGIYGDAAIALVRASGLMLSFKEWIEGEGDERAAVCRVQRKGEEVVEERFSVAQAKKARLWDERPIVKKKGRSGEWYEAQNDSPWHKYPDRMLKFRARGFLLRDTFADVLKGLATVEELQDITRTTEDEAPAPIRRAPPPPPSLAAPQPPAVTIPTEQAKPEPVAVEQPARRAPPPPRSAQAYTEMGQLSSAPAPNSATQAVEEASDGDLLEDLRNDLVDCKTAADFDRVRDAYMPKVDQLDEDAKREAGRIWNEFFTPFFDAEQKAARSSAAESKEDGDDGMTPVERVLLDEARSASLEGVRALKFWLGKRHANEMSFLEAHKDSLMQAARQADEGV
ncbi:hypothetical protein ABEG18_13200 [Alsobacter sp. KACC 23698]|uniref:Recombinase RecT n=1 Tax=Alsobacter sp. KACC 23698 TaxID=3149229 RepID=A0AAU7J8W1_9HYPH